MLIEGPVLFWINKNKSWKMLTECFLIQVIWFGYQCSIPVGKVEYCIFSFSCKSRFNRIHRNYILNPGLLTQGKVAGTLSKWLQNINSQVNNWNCWFLHFGLILSSYHSLNTVHFYMASWKSHFINKLFSFLFSVLLLYFTYLQSRIFFT